MLAEVVKDKPRFGLHRYQHIVVRRGDFEYLYVKEMGPEVLFPGATGFRFWAANLYSVGEAMEIADRARANKVPENRGPTNLIQAYQEECEEKRLLRRHATVSGPLLTVVRS